MPKPARTTEPGQYDALLSWLGERIACSGVSKKSLARALSQDSTQQINKYLSGRVVPSPKTLKKLCNEIGAPWPTAFVLAGYYGEILESLADLAYLSKIWKAQDAVWPEDEPQFRSTGVLRIKQKALQEAFEDVAIRRRYVVGEFEDKPTELVNEGMPEELFEGLKQFKEAHRKHYVVVPKPLGVAIFVAVSGFPRRGDVYKDDRSPYAAQVLEQATSLIDEARKHRPRRQYLPNYLQQTRDTLNDNNLPFGEKRAIGGELMNAWADSLCGRYTYYARLATFAKWGEIGSRVSTVTPWRKTPERKIAECPEPTEFAL